MQYWTIIDDRHAGPFSVAELMEMGIKPDSPIWGSGMPDWVEAAEIEEIKIAIRRRDNIPVTKPVESSPTPQPVMQQPQPAQPISQPVPQPQMQQPQMQQPQMQPVAPKPGPMYQQPASPMQQQWEWQRQPCVPTEPCPPSYLGWSIAVTLVCCQILGIVAIIFSAQTKQAYSRGDLDKAKKMSDRAQWMIILSIVLGLLCMPLQMAFMGI